MLTWLIFIPFLGAASLFIIKQQEIKKIVSTALIFSTANFIVGIMVFILFDYNSSESQFVTRLAEKGELAFGVDQISIWFVNLTGLTIPIFILSSAKIKLNKSSITQYIILIFLFQGFINIVFLSIDLILFYVCFEAVLIPLCLLTGIYGGMKRIEAAYLLFIYTLVGSLPILLGVVNIYNEAGTTHFTSLTLIHPDHHFYTWCVIFIGLAVKSPVVPFHLWLKTAHSEASVATSIILAGIVLKIATYGFLRLLVQLIPDKSHYYQNFIAIVCILSIIYTALSCLTQTDFKQLIAYSSINHISIVNLALFSQTVIGIEGGILLSLAHGLVSPALFYLLGGLLYDRYHNRSIDYYRGLTLYIPLFCGFFFFFTIANIATPLTANWVGEFLSIAGAFQIFPIITILASSTIVLSACYSIFLYNRISFGGWSSHIFPVLDISRIEYHIILPLIILTIILGLFPNIVLKSLHFGASILLFQS